MRNLFWLVQKDYYNSLTVKTDINNPNHIHTFLLLHNIR